MDSMDNFRERIEALEQRMKVMGAHTRMVERRLRWGRGIAWGVALGLLGMALWAMPVGAAPFAYVTHECDSSVSVIATATNTVVATIPIPNSLPFGVAITPDGAFAYVTNRNASSVSVIATATNTVVATIPVGLNPFGVAFTPDGAFAYVTNQGANSVSV